MEPYKMFAFPIVASKLKKEAELKLKLLVYTKYCESK